MKILPAEVATPGWDSGWFSLSFLSSITNTWLDLRATLWDGTHVWHYLRSQNHRTREAIGLGENHCCYSAKWTEQWLLMAFCSTHRSASVSLSHQRRFLLQKRGANAQTDNWTMCGDEALEDTLKQCILMSSCPLQAVRSVWARRQRYFKSLRGWGH